MASESCAVAAAVSKVKEVGLAGAVKIVVKTFLQQKHYQDLHKLLSEEWSHCHSLTAAVKLMEAHGVHLNELDQQRIQQMPEDRMIDALVLRMPEQTREQFEHFFLQLSLIASTTTRLRSALESGNDVAVEDVLDSAENVGILQFILKMAVAQAGNECKAHVKDHEDWLSITADRMAPLLQSQANMIVSKQALKDIKAQLELHHVTANEKTRKVLMSLVGSSMEALRASVFASWYDLVQTMKKEHEIRKEYAEEIEAAENRLQEYILQQTSIMKNMINRKSMDTEDGLLRGCMGALLDEWKLKGDRLAKEAEMKELEAKMAGFSQEQSAKSKKVLARMQGNNEKGLLEMCLQAWIQFIAEYNKNKELEDAVKAEEQKIAEFMKSHGESSKSVLNRMSQGSDSALIQQCFSGWVEVYQEQKKANEMEDLMYKNSAKFGSFGARNKASAGGAMDRAAQAQDDNTMIVIFWYWKRETRVERMKRYAKDKNSKKKQQLMGVKGLFKNFANELEQGLKDGTPRVADAGASQGYDQPA
jgi:hypothetical protein